MAHTPGPWKVSRGAQNHPYSIEGPTKTVAFIKMQTEMETTDGNARLIASVPDLLQACEAAKKYLEPDLVEPGRTVFWNLVAAIKKAKEES